MSIELKIKSKSLAAEAKIIRFEERKELNKSRYALRIARESGVNGDLNSEAYKLQNEYRSLNHHRRWDVRNESRATQLARAYLEEKPYKFVEQKRKPENEYTFQCFIVPRVTAMVSKYSNSNMEKSALKEAIQEWIDA